MKKIFVALMMTLMMVAGAFAGGKSAYQNYSYGDGTVNVINKHKAVETWYLIDDESFQGLLNDINNDQDWKFYNVYVTKFTELDRYMEEVGHNVLVDGTYLFRIVEHDTYIEIKVTYFFENGKRIGRTYEYDNIPASKAKLNKALLGVAEWAEAWAKREQDLVDLYRSQERNVFEY